MKATLVLVVFCGFLVGCGSDPPAATTGTCAKPAFINETSTPTSTFELLWATARQDVAAGGVALNAVSVTLSDTAPRGTPPDPRALNVKPCGVHLVNLPEVSAAELNALPHCNYCPYSDPTGILKCSASPTGYCNSFTDCQTVYVPASRPQNAEWEFMIIILKTLGYDVSGM